MKHLTQLIFVLFFFSNTFSQSIMFEKNYVSFGSGGIAHSVLQTADSGFIAAGGNTIGPFSNQLIVCKTDKFGNML